MDPQAANDRRLSSPNTTTSSARACHCGRPTDDLTTAPTQVEVRPGAHAAPRDRRCLAVELDCGWRLQELTTTGTAAAS
jgi:hypothetical protein